MTKGCRFWMELGATEYVLRPSRISKIAEVLQRLSQQWLKTTPEVA